MHGRELFDCLHLEDDLAFDDQINLETADRLTAIPQGNLSFGLNLKTCRLELEHQTGCVHRCEQPRPERTVDGKRATDDPFGE